MPYNQFAIGQIVKVNNDGRREGAFGYLWSGPEEMEVIAFAPPYQGEPMVTLRNLRTGKVASWREKWYEPIGGPW